MRIIVTGRQSGKTTKLIKIAAEKNLYIVCSTKGECGRINGMARELELHIPFPITFEEFMEHKYYGRGIGGFLIDNVEHLLQRMTEVPIYGITMTGAAEDGR